MNFVNVCIYVLGSILLLLLLIALIYFLFLRNRIFRLPLKRKGFNHAPAYPINIRRTVKALFGLIRRSKAVQQAKYGLTSNKNDFYEIGDNKATGYAFCYAKNHHRHKENAYADLIKQLQFNPFIFFGFGNSNDQINANKRRVRDYGEEVKLSGHDGKVDLTILSLEKPGDFDISWTTFGNVKGKAQASLKEKWVKSLTNPTEATKQFFPMLSRYGIAYNLLILQKVTEKNLNHFKKGELATVWTSEMDELYKAKKLYVIDLRIFNVINPKITDEENKIWSYTPATFTWLKQEENKDMTPIAVYIEGYEDKKQKISSKAQFYSLAEHENTTWIYALQAAKVSMTVFGIWLGHVYPWHLITAAMSMTLYNNVDKECFLYQLLGDKCDFLIGFNDALYLQWKNAGPPTSIDSTTRFLQVVDKYAQGRGFHEDDPKIILEKAGIKKADFTDKEAWDKYPMIKYLLAIWDNVEKYTHEFVNICYTDKNGQLSDDLVKQDKNLQKWIKKSREKGNIQGLSTIETTNALKRLLTSFIYRFTVHGLSRLDNTANPAMTFVPNFPPTLHIKENPDPSKAISTEELLKYLPTTGTIGKMLDFYFTFADSAPYKSLIPVDGIDQHLHFHNTGSERKTKAADLNYAGLDRDSGKAEQLNNALVQFRINMRNFMDLYNLENKIAGFEPDPVQYNQWPLGVET